MRIIHLARKPLEESSVAANILKHGTGAINVDAGRIAAPGEDIKVNSRSDEAGKSRGIYGDSSGHGTYQTEGQKLGRWPPNVILEHLEGCRCAGVKQVKATSIHGESTAVRRSGVHSEAGGHQTVGRTQRVSGYANEDGTESVEAWFCAPGCPVADLDATDSGGASRYYKQIKA